MEWMNRGSRPSPAPTNAAPGATTHQGHIKKESTSSMGMRIGSVVLLIASALLILALIASTILGKPADEKKYVKSDRLQAVFLNGGQVYFGNITTLNEKFMRVSNIYYLRVNQQVQPNQQNTQANNNDISLVKLGCELHGPEDEMLINREQVIFWENLKDKGQVANAVTEYVKQNPNGQNCNQNSGQGQSTNPSDTKTTQPSPAPTPSNPPTKPSN